MVKSSTKTANKLNSTGLEFDVTQYYKNNPNLRGYNASISYTQEQVSEVWKCMNDPIYFIRNYCKIVHVDKGVVPFDMWAYQEKIVNTVFDNRYSIIKLPRQAGKDLSLCTLIPTPDGFKEMRDIHVGDKIFGEDGKVATVTFESEIFTKNKIYRVTFDDGSSVLAGAEHLWTVNDRLNQKKKQKDKKYISSSHRQLTLSTQQILDSHWKRTNTRGYKEYAYYIDNCAPVEYNSKEVSIEPYLLGLWLGDGYSSGGNISGTEDNLNFFSGQLVKDKFVDFRKIGPNCYKVKIPDLTLRLASYNLVNREKDVHTKHIPPQYMFNDIESRISLLQGLMDTDGFINKKSGTCHIQLTRKNTRLINDIYTLICSLGLKVTRTNFEKTNSTRLSFSVSKDKFNAFRLPSKLERQKDILTNSRYVYSRTIQNIELVDTVPSKCIQVDNESHLFLCTNSYIPTHNTTTIAALLCWYMLFKDNQTIAVLANKETQSKEILGRVKLMYENVPLWMQSGVTSWAAKSVTLENGNKIICAATSSSAIRGMSITFAYLDEFAFVPNRLQEEFYTSTIPTISSGTTTKICITSTPKGFNLFYKIWNESVTGKNDYKAVDIHYSETPGRDEAWAASQKAIIGETKFKQEYECVDGNTIITLFDKRTREEFDIRIKDAYDFGLVPVF